MKKLTIHNLKKTYGKVEALKGIDITLDDGEVYGFIGPNGAGKTTSIRVLLGLLKADSGEVCVFGKDAWKEAMEIHKRLAYVPGEVNLWPNLTGGEVIDLFIKLRGAIDEKKRDALIEQFDLDPRKKCRTYSKGNRQKIALIAAFASNAELFVLDEPTTGLDPLMEQIFQNCVREAKLDGKSVFLSSHILSEVEKLCDKLSIIRDGRIIESGSLAELRHLTRTRIIIKTNRELPVLDSIQGVHDVQKQEYGLTFQVDSQHLGRIIKELSQFDITKLECSPPTLEELFMNHYKGVS